MDRGSVNVVNVQTWGSIDLTVTLSATPGPADLLKQLLHGHLVPLLGVRSSPGSFSRNLKHKEEDERATNKQKGLSKDQKQ